jgi:AbrB family looped-hinge helix DNA binding protein
MTLGKTWYLTKMKAVTQVSSKGQIVLPAAIRQRLGLAAGDRLTVEVGAGDRRIVLRPVVAGELEGRLRQGYRWFASGAGDPVEALHAARRQARARERRRP